MAGSRKTEFLSAATMAAASAAIAVVSVDLFFGMQTWPARLGCLAAAATAAALAAMVWQTGRSDRRAFERYLDAICRLGIHDLENDAIAGELPPLPANSCWQPLASRVRQTLLDHHRHVQDLEQERVALEIRCRRASQQADRIQGILSGMADPIIAIDNLDDVVLANQAAQDLFHLDVEGEDRALARLVHCQKLVELLTAACHRPSAAQRTDELELADELGQPQWYRVRAARLESGENGDAPRGAVAILRDVSDHKALQKRNAEFVSAVSHEMKTPLAGIKAYVELLADGDAEDEETREEFLAVINGQADRLQRLVDNMLNLARIEAGVVHVHKEQRPLNALLEEAARVVQPAAEAKAIELVADLSPLYLGVLADRDMLLQAAINLLSNAVKYTPNGGRVTLRSRLDGDKVIFEVEDTGVGLSEEDCRRVFEKFYRVKKDKEMASGTGLGLPLAKHIVEDVHGGELTVRSTLGAGSTFRVTLPGTKQLS